MAEILGLGCVSYDMLSVIPEMPAWEAVEYIADYQVQQGGIAATATVAPVSLARRWSLSAGSPLVFKGNF
jgi:hypothetical protein